MAPGRDPTRTQDYRIPRGREHSESSIPPEPVGPSHATRPGVGHDDRHPPPAVLPRRERPVSSAMVLCLATHDALFRATLARVLVRAGCDVTVIHDASDVKALTEAPDVAILDFDGNDAPSLFGAFREACPSLPFLVLTSDPSKVARALKLMRVQSFEVLERRSTGADVLEAASRLRG